jgi:DNA-directed RNA polymerase specialized sigma24 family protein
VANGMAADRAGGGSPPPELVKLRYFVGLTIEETAQVLGISEPTAKRHWAYARAWLYEEIRNTR